MSQGKPSQNQRTVTWRGTMTEAVVAERKSRNVAGDMFKLAQKCADVDEFLAQCGMEEDWVLSEEAGQMRMEEVPRCWTQAKSDIKGAFKAGVDLTKVPSYSKMKAKKADINAANQQGRQQAEAEATDAENTNDNQAPREAATGGERDKRDGKPDTSLEEALAAGTVVDAESTELVPEHLRELVHLLGKLSNQAELRYTQRVKEFTKTVRDDLSLIGTMRNKGGKRDAA